MAATQTMLVEIVDHPAENLSLKIHELMEPHDSLYKSHDFLVRLPEYLMLYSSLQSGQRFRRALSYGLSSVPL